MFWEGLYSLPIPAALLSGGPTVFISRQWDFSGRTELLRMLLGAAGVIPFIDLFRANKQHSARDVYR
ncbi:MAG: hypothetical protein R6V29_04635, partial [Spirochaetia bacterium]